VREYLQDQLGDFAEVEVQPKTEVRRGRASLRDLRSNRESHGEDQHTRRVVPIDLLPHNDGLRSLRDDAQRGQPQGVKTFGVTSGETTGVQAREALLKTAIVRSIGANQAGQLGHIWVARARLMIGLYTFPTHSYGFTRPRHRHRLFTVMRNVHDAFRDCFSQESSAVPIFRSTI